MGVTAAAVEGDSESAVLLIPVSTNSDKPPKDSFHLAYTIYFTLGSGYLLPWNTFVTAVDYFSYLYPDASVDRVFAIVYTLVGLTTMLVVIALARRENTFARINLGYAMFLVALGAVPLMDVWYVKGRVGIHAGFHVTMAAVGLCGVADALVEAGVVGSAGELPQRYMQALVAGTAASGVLVSILRVITKSIFPRDAQGLRKSANLYFTVSIMVVLLNVVLYNIAHRLPVIKYYKDLKSVAVNEDLEHTTDKLWKSTLWDIVGTVKWYGSGILVIFIVTLSIYPGSITEDVHSDTLKDWYPIILITCYHVSDLIGKTLAALYLVKNAKIAIGGSFGRLLLLPLFYGCLHGPDVFRTEIPVAVLTFLLGLTNGYFTSVLVVLGTKTVKIQHAEMAGIVLVLYLMVGLAIGSVVSWFWV